MPPFDEYGSGWDQTSPNVARVVAQYGQGDLGPQQGPAPWMNTHDDPDLLTRIMRSLFGSGQKGIISQPLAPPVGGQAMDPLSPFGGQSQAPPEPKPVSRLSSNRAIVERINKMLTGADEPPPVMDAEWGMPDGSGAASAPFNLSGMPGNPWDRLPPFNVMQSGMIPGQMPQRVDMRNAANPNPSPFGRANGGSIPHLMRGGFPDLYDRPIRQATFDSGGQSYVGADYSDAPGRADDVNAKLSAREYVMDAETMALLGDGNPDAGAKKMDEMRANIRKHKGAALAKGKISPDAKQAASSYIAGNPLGDGLRRRGREKS